MKVQLVELHVKVVTNTLGNFSNERFSSSLGETDQETHAAKTVRTILKEIVNNEKDLKPLVMNKFLKFLKKRHKRS